MLLELERREEERIAKQFRKYLKAHQSLSDDLAEAARMVMDLESSLGEALFRDFLVGYLVIIDAAINAVGWGLDLVGHHTLPARVLLNGWGAMFDAGYFWHFNELWIGGAAGPGEKGWEVGLILTVFTMRIAAAIGFLQMKRWGHQWMVVTCWMGVVICVGYVFNMTMYADVRYAGVVFPVIGRWIYDILYITPFLAVPYLHAVNREIFSD